MLRLRPHSPLLALALALPLTALACSGGVGDDAGDTFSSFTTGGPTTSGVPTTETGDMTSETGDMSTTTTTTTGGGCGDMVCDPGTEDCMTCAEDCGACTWCGDFECNADENCETCALDCGVCPGCGDGTCSAEENCDNCPQDCDDGCGGPYCGDGLCNGTDTCENCEQDCGGCDSCGNGLCDNNEDCNTCQQDCGACPSCPNGACDNGETCNSCQQDCGDCTCPCSGDPNFNNFCHYGPNTPGCPMTQPGGYCDPNGDGSYQDGDWNLGFFDYAGQCG